MAWSYCALHILFPIGYFFWYSYREPKLHLAYGILCCVEKTSHMLSGNLKHNFALFCFTGFKSYFGFCVKPLINYALVWGIKHHSCFENDKAHAITVMLTHDYSMLHYSSLSCSLWTKTLHLMCFVFIFHLFLQTKLVWPALQILRHPCEATLVSVERHLSSLENVSKKFKVYSHKFTNISRLMMTTTRKKNPIHWLLFIYIF